MQTYWILWEYCILVKCVLTDFFWDFSRHENISSLKSEYLMKSTTSSYNFDSSALDEIEKYSEYIIFMFSKVYYSNPNVFSVEWKQESCMRKMEVKLGLCNFSLSYVCIWSLLCTSIGGTTFFFRKKISRTITFLRFNK